MPKQSKESTFGRGLMRYISSRLPYQSNVLIDNLGDVNPKFKHFYKTGSRRQEQLALHSISTSDSMSQAMAGGLNINQSYQNFMYANLDQDKSKRLRDYRTMAAFSEVADALDEICDEIVNIDDDGKVAKLILRERDFSDTIEAEIQKEFRKFIDYFDLKTKGWEYFRNILIDGECYFENIVHKDHVDKGILGVIAMPNDLVDPIYDNVQNLIIKGYLLRKPNTDETGPAGTVKIQPDKIELIPFDKNQVTYMNSGVWNEDKTMRIPFIENARRSYRQLSLIEDAIVIYRLVRAPERLVFNVDVGNMPAPKAEAYLKKLMSNYWSRKTYDSSQGHSVQSFSPQSMLDSFWFAKRANSEGTSVNQLEGGANLGELSDLLYFVRKLYKALKVPVNRVDPESQWSSSDGTMLREELKFAKFVIRLQQQFARGLKDTFITHLKLRKMWSEYNLKENNLTILFNPPSNFHELRESQKLELRYNNYNMLSQNELISNTYAQKKHLQWSDLEVKANREWMRKDAAFRWELAQIETAGPEWKKAQELAAQQPQPGAPGAMGAPMGGAPPAFGPPPGGEGLPPVEGEIPGAPAGAPALPPVPGAGAPPPPAPPV